MNETFPSISSSSSSSSPSASDALMAFVLSLPPSSFSALSSSLAADLRLLRSRLALLLLSPAHFSRALSRLRALPLPLKSLLLARLLLRSLRLLLLSSSVSSSALQPHPHPHRLRLLDLDAALLLMAMCDSYHPPHHRHPVDWRSAVAAHALSSALSPAALGDTPWAVIGPYVDLAAKCPRFLEIAGSSNGGGKMGAGVRAAVAAVVALPSVEYGGEEGGVGGSRECAVCREEMAAGRQVCELPCGHRFHWGCALAWLRKRNTCPCCRFELPTEDVFAEMRRLWRAVVRIGTDRPNCGCTGRARDG